MSGFDSREGPASTKRGWFTFLPRPQRSNGLAAFLGLRRRHRQLALQGVDLLGIGLVRLPRVVDLSC
ncbi:hypothetical protein [Salinisphaera sp. LB1]|uniref:hypothetical protein n=1 Tax=Salinisphaera sp. LB1 TaxID=2183911 RepID=UPI0015CFF4D8|nr:hypothetical protein [Salinisphaera sp. LB1]